MKSFNKILPLIDYLYIFQQFEYDKISFLKWFLKHPFERDLQRKHKIEWTSKGLLVFGLAIFLLLVSTLVIFWGIETSFTLVLLLILVILALANIFPLYLVGASILLWFPEYYQKTKIGKSARKKIESIKNLKVVAITGSFAKTSTKDILYTLLWKNFRVVKTPKSFNTLISISRSILTDLKPNSEVFLCEMDAYHKGEIDELSSVVKPDIGVITAIAPQHLERFGSMETLARTQFELANNLKKDGVLVSNGGDEWQQKLEGEFDSLKIFFGGDRSELLVSDIRMNENGTSFKLSISNTSVNVEIPLYGEHHVQNFLAASTVAYKLGLPLKRIAERAKWLIATPHRMEVSKFGEVKVIDNSYNTNPYVYIKSLELLSKIKGDKKIVITPGLVELGSKHNSENKLFGERVAQVADEAIVVGNFAKSPLLQGLKDGAMKESAIHLVKNTKEGIDLGLRLAGEKGVVLIENDLPDQYF